MSWEEYMEREWGPSLVHESGHALMALLQGIPCHGIYFERGEDGAGQFCALFANPSDKRSNKDYLVSAAGVAAELLIYPNQNSEGAEADRADFGSLGAPSFEDIVNEACLILSGERRRLENLISKLKARIRSVDFDLGRLPEVGMDGSDRRYLTLLNEKELEACIALHHP
jgi:hypothetical protein